MFFFQFAYHNDLGFWAYGEPGKDHHMFWETGHLVIFFRPVGAVILNLMGWILREFRGIETLTYARAYNLILLIALALLITEWLSRKISITSRERFLFSIFTFLHPAWFLSTSWIAQSMQGLYSIGASQVGAMIYIEALRIRKTSLFLISGFLIVISFYIYPPGTMAAFLPFILGNILKSSSENRSHEKTFSIYSILKFGIFFGAACGFALAIHRPFIQPLLCEPGPGRIWCASWVDQNSPTYNLSLATNLEAKFNLIPDLLRANFGGWVTTVLGLESISLPLLAVLFAICFVNSKKQVILQLVLGIVAIVVLSLPNLVTQGSILAYRNQIALTPLLGVIAIRASNSSRFANGFIHILGACLLCTHIYLSIQILNRNQDAFHLLEKMPNLVNLCIDGEKEAKISTLYLNEPKSDIFSVDRPGSERREMDLTLSVFAPWTYRGICHLLAFPGSPFEKSAPGL